ncbi:MAG: hypothetical protein V3U49_03930 [Nitrososphaerales archaeon]
MPEINSIPSVHLLREELESWKPFLNALRGEDREIARKMFEECWRFVSAIESSGKTYLVESVFLTILLIQQTKIKWLESEVNLLRKEDGEKKVRHEKGLT